MTANARMRLAFMGTPAFAAASLQALIDAGHDLVAVYTQPPRAAGRGKKPRLSDVYRLAEQQGLPIFTPASLKSAEVQDQFRQLKLDAAVVAAYGLILPPPILEAPAYGCINVHASLLPRWRGAAPIHRAVLAGDRQTGITIMRMEEGLDTGPMLAWRGTDIGAEETSGQLHDRLARLGADLLVETLPGLADIQAEVQPEDGVCYAAKIDKSEARLDWHKPAEDIDRQVRGLAPFPGAWTMIEGERIKILAGQAVMNSGEPGLVLDDRLTIGCGTGSYRVTLAQRPGKAPMEASALLRGFPIDAGVSAQ